MPCSTKQLQRFNLTLSTSDDTYQDALLGIIDAEVFVASNQGLTPAKFSLTSTGLLEATHSDGTILIANQPYNPDGVSPLFFNTAFFIDMSERTNATCSASLAGNSSCTYDLQCTVQFEGYTGNSFRYGYCPAPGTSCGLVFVPAGIPACVSATVSLVAA